MLVVERTRNKRADVTPNGPMIHLCFAKLVQHVNGWCVTNEATARDRGHIKACASACRHHKLEVVVLINNKITANHRLAPTTLNVRVVLQVQKTTSPIQEGERRPVHYTSKAQPSGATAAQQKGGSHVRFVTDPRSSSLEKQKVDPESSESETENTTNDEEAHTTVKFLLLTDQLSVDTKKHLSIKDIGVILDRLSSKIVDVEKLDREVEEEDCFNWTIKATIRGDTLRELGVVYNGHYYSISEHPGYGQKKEEEEEEEEDGADDKEVEKEPV
ncbi:hypothetical protein O3P69_006830 [Scylla paramamosain]|uniref:Uncharacterized protein n=1 Tax=Scylla paramamosain TaxID=85552 RepID=A0AAW0U3C9_SCYPA